MSERAVHIALFGGSGATGHEVVASAVERGWRVSGLVRRAGALWTGHADIREIVGSFEKPDGVRETVTNTDAIIIVIGPRPPYEDVFCAAATRSIAGAAREIGVTRLVCLTGALVGDYPKNQGVLFRLMGKMFATRARDMARDRVEQENVVRTSGLRWTLVKPPRLTHGPRTGRVTTGAELRVGLLSAISRKDLANVLLDLSVAESAAGQTFFVKGGR